MSRLTDLLARAKELDPQLGADLEKEIRLSSNKRSFGLVFERHLPDNVELPTRPVRRGDSVRVLPPRGSATAGDPTVWRVVRIDRQPEGERLATLVESRPADDSDPKVLEGVDASDLVVIARHDDTNFPGLVQTGEVVNSTDPETPFHTVINAENLHALNLLTYTHRHKVDCIYIDPPYNTGAKDWKYNNDYVDGEDAYRHSKWLSFMEKRLELAKDLLNPEDSVLIVTIDEKEYLRLGMLLEQTFPEATIQMVSSVINPMGSGRSGTFSRVDEYLYFVMNGTASVPKTGDDMLSNDKFSTGYPKPVRWTPLHRDGSNWKRVDRPNSFFPLHVDPVKKKIVDYGEALPLGVKRSSIKPKSNGLVVVWPMKGEEEARWQISGPEMLAIQKEGFLKIGKIDPRKQTASISYLSKGVREKVLSGAIVEKGRDEYGARILFYGSEHLKQPRSVWNKSAHSARDYGSSLIRSILPNRAFPFPKSLYAVEDTVRFFVADKPNATILDFFSGSGTTAHAVMRLNKQDDGKRRSISVTNNEVSFEEAKRLTKEGFRPGDPEWERLGICDYVTKPRIEAAITGRTPGGEAIKGNYKFTDESPISDGFDANARFFTLTYEPPTRVRHGRAFDRIAPLLWLRAGQFGKILDSIPEQGWAVVESHGVIQQVGEIEAFMNAVREVPTVTTVYIVTDDDLIFQSAVSSMADLEVEFVQLYSSYLTNFAFTASQGRAGL